MLSRGINAIGIALLFAALSSSTGAADNPTLTLYVDANAPPGPGDGLSWSTAYHRLEDAIAAAVLPGTEIRVADGVYYPDGGSDVRAMSFLLNTGVTIRGGYAGFGAPNPNYRNPGVHPTILSGDIGIPGDTSDNSYHVVRAVGTGAGSMLSGVTIRSGKANGSFPDDRGAGVLLTTGSHHFEGCRFQFHSGVSGGAVDLGNGSSPIFLNCMFDSNLTNASGGAVTAIGSNATFINCTFLDNSAELSGGAISASGGEPLLAGCIFINNSSIVFGGAYYAAFGISTLINCSFSNNFMLNSANISHDGGGALYNHNGTVMVYDSVFSNNVTSDDGAAVFNRIGTLHMERCILRSNWSADRGGGIYSWNGVLELANCAFIGNTGAFAGGGLFLVDTSTTIANVTFFSNKSNGLAGGIQTSGGSIDLHSSIFWGNFDTNGTTEQAQLRWISGGMNVNYNCMSGWSGIFGGTGNIGSSPMFVNALGPDGIAGTQDDDLRLLPSSPCINGGDPMIAIDPEATDLDGSPRIMGCRIDMGAYEFITGAAHTGDIDANGVIDGRDISGFMQAMLGIGPPAYHCVADLNADQDVDSQDLELFIELLLDN